MSVCRFYPVNITFLYCTVTWTDVDILDVEMQTMLRVVKDIRIHRSVCMDFNTVQHIVGLLNRSNFFDLLIVCYYIF